MADETENVGGISIGVGIDDSKAEADLNAFLARLTQIAQQRVIPVQVAIQQPTAAAQRQAQQAQQQSTQLTFGGRARGAASAQEATGLERAIAEALAKEGKQTADTTKTALDKGRQSANLTIEQALAQSVGAAATTVPVSIDDAEFREQFGQLLTDLRAFVSEASRIATIRPTLDPTSVEAARQGISSVVGEEPQEASIRPVLDPRSVEAAEADAETLAAGVSQNVAIRPALDTAAAEATRREAASLAAEASSTAAIRPTLDQRAAASTRQQAADLAEDTEEELSEKATLRRKPLQARDIGVEADPSRVYTFDPDVYAREEALAQAKSRRAQEQLLSRRGVTPTETPLTHLIDQFEEQAEQRSRLTPDQERQLRELSFEAERESIGVRTSSTLVGGPRRTESEIRAFREAEARRANQQQRPFTAPEQAELERRRARAVTVSGAASRQIDENAPQTGRVRPSSGGGAGVARRDEEDAARREEQQTAVAVSQRFTQARTARTLASGFGGFLLGQSRQQIEATNELRRAESDLTLARRRLYSPEVRGNVRAYRQAQEEVVVATNNVAAALEKVQAFATPVSAARTLAAVTVAGAAFGIGLKAVDFALGAVSTGLQNFVDIQTGFSTTSARVTTQLGAQSRALNGNAEAALANAEATAGISASASAAIDPQLRLITQIKAGALAMADASDLFRAAAGGGRAPTGLVGGFGGVLGSSLFAQQLGGGRGFSELVAENIRSVAGGPLKAEPEPLRFGIPGLPGPLGAGGGVTFREQTAEEAAAAVEAVGVQLDSLNDAARRGASLTGDLTRVEFERTNNLDDIRRATEAATEAENTYFQELAKGVGSVGSIVVRLNGQIVDSAAELNKALALAATGQGIPDVAQLRRAALAQQRRDFEIQSEVQVDLIRRQQAREQPSQLAAAERQQQLTQAQFPAEAALQRLAAPPPPIGTGIVAANAEEQERINAGQQRSIELQGQLNSYYAEGEATLRGTSVQAQEVVSLVDQVAPQFGVAIRQSYQAIGPLADGIKAIGQEIASISAGIANQQAQYQVAQYNFQLSIARRTLADIGGLTGRNFGEGQSYLGVLERQNLALSRQAQLLQFSLAQRQINFQQALAGFEAPGVTPEERQANVKQAQIEADFAQKQLDIQRQMFGNQVQIVDIQNLRQGADLAAQIGLLLQGRQLTIDGAQAQETITRLQAQSAALVSQVGTYLTKINNLTSVAYGQITQLEAAAGRAMYSTAYTVLDAFGNVFLPGLADYLNSIGRSSQTDQQPGKTEDDRYNASGYVGLTSGKTMTGVGWMGEANQEAYAILRNPKPLSGGLGGGTTMIVNFGDVYVREDSDITRIAEAVIRAMGSRASLAGLRLAG